MPELPDVTLYIEALEKRIWDQPLERVRLASLPPAHHRACRGPPARVFACGGSASASRSA
jgi:hypothetical protein